MSKGTGCGKHAEDSRLFSQALARTLLQAQDCGTVSDRLQYPITRAARGSGSRRAERAVKAGVCMADLNSLIIFAKIVEAGSLSEAARRLGMPVSTISRRLADLEDHLGVRLLERSTRSLRLTEVGSEVIRDANRSAALSLAVDDSVSRNRDIVAGSLRLSGPPNISGGVLTPLALKFQTSYPDVHIRIITTDRSIDHIQDDVDLAFVFGELKNSTLIAQRILTCRPQLVASPSYLEKCGAPVSPSDLPDHRILASSHLGSPNSWVLRHQNGTDVETVEFSPSLVVSDFSSLNSALLEGAGIGNHILLEKSDRSQGSLVRVLPEWHLPLRDLSIVYPGNRNLSRAIRAFKDFAIKTIPSLFNAPRNDIGLANHGHELVEHHEATSCVE